MESQKGGKSLDNLKRREISKYRARIFPKMYGRIAQAILELLDIYYDEGIHAERVPKKIFDSLMSPSQISYGDVKLYTKIVIEDLKACGLIRHTGNDLHLRN